MVSFRVLALACALALGGCVTPGLEATVTPGDGRAGVELGQRHYAEGNYGLAEQHFRRAVEASPDDGEAWLGLAASYDRLKRFDLADTAYKHALELAGPIPEVLNNQGYSYMLRGDFGRAHGTLMAARLKDPGNPSVNANIALLQSSMAAN